MSLHVISINNNHGSTPVVFLHGFGGVGGQWRSLQTAISDHAPTLAIDLPGHGNSLSFPKAGPPIVAAKAVLAEMNSREIEKAHFVGHSMGGAIASLIALVSPQSVASLTLLAPGGYGTDFNHPLLVEWAAARSREELEAVMPKFFGPDFESSAKTIEFQHALRTRPGANEALIRIAQSMSKDGKQGMLPVADILAGDYPISVVWGNADQVLPVSHGEALLGKVDLHLVDNMGHSPAEEAPEMVQRIILKQLGISS